MEISTGAQQRASLRRAVHVSCTVRSELWDGPAPFRAVDLSPEGVRLCSPLALPAGQEVVLTFTPPRWPDEAGPINAVARVAHVAMPRRRSDLCVGLAGEAGMGLSFVQLDQTHRALLALTLRGLPPPLPLARPLCAALQESAEVAVDETVLVHDGVELSFVAQAPLLVAPRVRIERGPLAHGEGFTSSSVLRRAFASARYRALTVRRSRVALSPAIASAPQESVARVTPVMH